MHDRTPSGQGTRRLFLVVASLIIGSCVWFFLLDSDQIVAEESRTADTAVDRDGPLAARVGDLPITEREIRDAIAERLAEAERVFLAEALEQRIRDLLLDAEAAHRGIDRATLLRQEVDAQLHRVPDAAVADVLARSGRTASADVEHEIRRQLRLDAFCAELERNSDVARFARGVALRQAALARHRPSSAG